MSDFSQWLEESYLKWQISAGERSTLSDFAEYLGISRVSLSQYLHDARVPSQKHMAKITRRLGPILESEAHTSYHVNFRFRHVKTKNIGLLLVGLLGIVVIGIFAFSRYQNAKPEDLPQSYPSITVEDATATEPGINLLETAEFANQNASATANSVSELQPGDCNVIGPMSDLKLCDLRGIDLRGVDLTETDLRGANLESSNLSSADLSGADLTGAQADGADFSSTNLSKAKMVGVVIVDSDFSYANLEGADLTGANLRGSNLTWVNFKDAVLWGVDLSDCNMLNAMLDVEQASTIFRLDNALLPLNLR